MNINATPDNLPSDIKIDRLPNQSALVALHNHDNLQKEPLPMWYIGGIRVFNDIENPDRYAVAAHEFREVLEKVFKNHSPQAKTEFHNLMIRFKGIYGGKLPDTIGDSIFNDKTSIIGFLKKCLKVFSSFDETEPNQEEHFKKKLSIGNDSDIPDAAQKAIYRHYKELQSYFIKISHHRFNEIDESEFEGNLRGFEMLVIRVLEPGTLLDDSRHIIRIIREGESSG